MKRIIPILLIAISTVSLVCAQPPAGEPQRNEFYAMDTNFNDGKARSPEETAKLLKELGYSGYGFVGMANIPQWLAALDKEGLKLYSIYVGVDIDSGKIDPTILQAVEQLRGRPTVLWVYTNSKKFKPSDAGGDDAAVPLLRELADRAHDAGLKIALYPHISNWVETILDAVRVSEKVNRRNLGASFNLCHHLKILGEEGVEQALMNAAPYLLQVQINGADSGDTKQMGWDKLIQPLDVGSYDVSQVLRVVRRIRYAGPIALQGYGIKGDTPEILKRSIEGWNDLWSKLPARPQRTRSN
ncbi:MAG: sugar phosphate isomerase/epimerase [Phycisphaerae bacterium]|nr:sugar phosphate isomerase/epimerase [Phycisphaerae bacterium]